MEETKITYECVSEFAGHQTKQNVVLSEAAQDIFSKVKEKAMQCAIGGTFVNFESIEELSGILKGAAGNTTSIRVYDEIIGG